MVETCQKCEHMMLHHTPDGCVAVEDDEPCWCTEEGDPANG